MTNIAVSIPPSLQNYREHLREFLEGMIHKLHINSHKDTPNKASLPQIMALLKEEIREFDAQIAEDRFDNNSLRETFDQANFAFLAFVALRNTGTKTAREELIDEYFNVDVENGKVFVKKAKPGSIYKLGDEVKGNRRGGGYVDITINTFSKHGRALSVPRSHIVWWKKTGKWPVGVVDHINGERGDDRGENLRDVSFSENAFNTTASKNRALPRYVVKYTAPNRWATGKYVYQRYHRGKNIRVGYFDTPDEAATLGAAKWAERAEQHDTKSV